MTTSLGQTIDTVAEMWARYMTGALIDASIGLALVGIIWLIARKWQSARWGYLLFLIVPLKLLIPIQAPVIPLSAHTNRGIAVSGETGEVTSAAHVPMGNAARATASGQPVAADNSRAASRSASTIQKSAGDAVKMPSIAAICMLGWLVVVGLSLGRFVANHRQLHRQVTRATPIVVDDYGVKYRRLCRQIGVRQTMGVFASNSIDVPAVVGLWRPRILIPRGLLESLDAHQLSCVIAHELAHLKWYDLWAAFAERLVRIVHFANPAVWVASYLTHVHRELACDEVALAANDFDRKVCGTTLLDVLEFANRRGRRPHPAVAMFRHSQFHGHRLRRIMAATKRTTQIGWGGFLSLGLLAALILPNVRAAEPKQSKAEPDEPRVVLDPSKDDLIDLEDLPQVVEEGDLVEVCYPIGDLVEFGTDPDTLLELITSNILASGWSDVGGPGLAEFDTVESQLVITQVESVHLAIARLLAELRTIAEQRTNRTSDAPLPSLKTVDVARERDQVHRIFRVSSLLFADPRQTDPMYADFDAIVSLVTRVVAPDSWDEVGGPGSIGVWPAGEVMVVCQTPENQKRIARLLRILERVPAASSGDSPSEWAVSFSQRTDRYAPAPDRPAVNVVMQTKIYYLHDLLPTETGPVYWLSPRAVGLDQLNSWLRKRVNPQGIMEPVDAKPFRTKAALVVTTPPPVHDRMARELRNLWDQLSRRRSVAERRAAQAAVFQPAHFGSSGWWGDMTPNCIYLHGTCSADDQLAKLGALANRLEVRLIDSDVTDRGLTTLANFSDAVHYLHLWSRHVTPQGLAQVAKLKQLNQLDLTGTTVSDEGLAALAPLKGLQRLTVQGRGITDQSAATIAAMGEIWFLDISNTSITDAGLKTLVEGRQWLTLKVNGTRITNEAIDSLRETHPHIRVMR